MYRAAARFLWRGETAQVHGRRHRIGRENPRGVAKGPQACCHPHRGHGGDKVLGGIHVGYEHSYALRKGWKLFWQAKCDLMIKGEDLFRTGIVIGVKIPTK